MTAKYEDIDRKCKFGLHIRFKCHDIVLHLSWIFYSLIVSNDNDFDSTTKALVDDKRKKNIMALEAMKQMKLCGVIEMYTTTLIFIISFYLMGIGITAPVENK